MLGSCHQLRGRAGLSIYALASPQTAHPNVAKAASKLPTTASQPALPTAILWVVCLGGHTPGYVVEIVLGAELRHDHAVRRSEEKVVSDARDPALQGEMRGAPLGRCSVVHASGRASRDGVRVHLQTQCWQVTR
jgi:hypothetical protein